MESGSFSWTIPDFPVITLDFRKVRFEHDNKEQFGLINKDDSIEKGRYVCTNHCSITINEQECIVLWQLLPNEQTKEVTSPTVQIGNEGVESLPIEAANTAHNYHLRCLEHAFLKKGKRVWTLH